MGCVAPGAPGCCVCLETELYLAYRKTFLIPEIMYDPSLLLSPHVFLLAILYRHRAFKSERLNDNLGLLDSLKLSPSENEMRLALKPEIMDKFIFRRALKTPFGYDISDETISLAMMSEWISTVGRLAGFEYNTIAYSLRYMAGNSLDQNCECSNACLSGPVQSVAFGPGTCADGRSGSEHQLRSAESGHGPRAQF